MPIESETYILKPDDIPLATDGLSQPTFYVDFIRGTVLAPEVIKLNFIDVRTNAQTNEVVMRHVVTLVTPKSQIRAWAKFLNDVADENGLPPLEIAGPQPGTAIQDANG